MITVEEFKQELVINTFSVKWKVRNEIGPEWIGSSREICFYKNSKPIEDNLIHTFLKNTLIEKVNIPEKSEDDIIEGEGELVVLGNQITVKFRISYTTPYAYPHKYENGKVVFLSEINE